MTQGIREFTNAKFGELLEKRAEFGNTGFRKAVMQAAMATFSISLASAATHYNHSLKTAREIDPSLVEGLGRPDDKKGGRKPIHVVDVVKVSNGEVVAAGISKAKAEALVIAALAKGKTKLEIKEIVSVEKAPEVELIISPDADVAVGDVQEELPA